MPLITIGFNQDINVSVQVRDLAWYVPTNTLGVQGNQYETNDIDNIVFIGKITNINGNTITVDYIGALPQPGNFIMFAKDRSVNMSSLLGYFAKFRIRNNSQDKAEMYSIAVDVTESSK